ncbi:nucleoside hydrolase [Phanerochaete sordida]|uniref:Nucleoside hydrolase n=1 Tax=Phanerochaete sordida TaxID=48140 RepID=A0A9P3FWE0_9APHY|nr:nucleoside hydrolase [Phanerochaete sordida]
MRYVWLDCDPGHDDATAILLALHIPNITLLGVSTVHGNTSADDTMKNAARCLHAFAAPNSIKVYPGATQPLLRPARFDPEIHGVGGLGGVEGLPSVELEEVRARLPSDPATARAVEGMATAIRGVWKDGTGSKVVLVSSGPMTNIALFSCVHPELLEAVEEIVFMGGGVGLGNRSSAAEFNILCDPEAAQIVLNIPLKKTMIPLNVTHTAIVTRKWHSKVLRPGSAVTDPAQPLPAPQSALRRMLSTLLSFFADAYKAVFGFVDGPPIHDALTIAYVARSELFAGRRLHVDVELTGAHTVGETVVDLWDYLKADDTWGRTGKNCIVTESLNVDGFFELFLDAIARCDKVSPLNQ